MGGTCGHLKRAISSLFVGSSAPMGQASDCDLGAQLGGDRRKVPVPRDSLCSPSGRRGRREEAGRRTLIGLATQAE